MHQETNNLIVYHGYRLGGIENKNTGDKVYINNFLELKLSYHKHGEFVSENFNELDKNCLIFHIKKLCFSFRNQFRVVGFEVEAKSIDYRQINFKDNVCINPTGQLRRQYVNPKGTSLLFFYSVEWKESDVSWASRWDIYLGMRDVEIHWFSIINSLVVVFFLSGNAFLYIYKM